MITRLARVSLVTLLLSLLGLGTAFADQFVPLPEVGGHSKTMKIRFVRYDGSTNGEMVVEVQNASKTAQKFTAEGVFFVPKGDPEKAPQRLGAAGPFMEIAKGKKSAHQTEVTLAPGETKRLHLEVFCIDSHRSSPSSDTKFAIAKNLLPKELRQEISAGSKQIIHSNKGDVAKSKSAIQSHTWKTRDKKWIKLEGERKNEKAAPRNELQIQRRNHPSRNAPRKNIAPQQRID